MFRIGLFILGDGNLLCPKCALERLERLFVGGGGKRRHSVSVTLGYVTEDPHERAWLFWSTE